MACCSPRKENIHVTVDNDEFSCPLCCDLFQEPKLLPNCAHNFCKSCLDELVRRSGREISCPICRVVSSIPPHGVTGFPTNTLLVRLIDNIPGRKEKQELQKSLALCKEEIERKKGSYRLMESKLKVITRNRDLAEGLKKEISTHANQYVEAIKKYEKELCAEVDAFSMKNCGLSSLEKLENEKMKLEENLNDAASAVVAVGRALRSEERELEEKIHTMKSQLREYLNIPTTSVLQELGEVKEFDMEFNKNEIKMGSGLGKVFSKQQHSRETAAASVSKQPGTASVQQNGKIPQKENDEFSAYCDRFTTATGIASSNFFEGTVTKHIPLKFTPFAVAVSSQTGEIALLCRERRQVHCFFADGQYLNTIHIKYGDLWDVAFSSDDDVIVVNRANNRLLFYEENGWLVDREVEVPRTCLKFTYLSVDERGRLIVTSTRVPEDDEDDDIVQCLIVYPCDSNASDKMFGRWHLKNAVSRGIFFQGRYYVSDRISEGVVLRVFNEQGKFLNVITHLPSALPTSVFSISLDIVSDRFIMCCQNNSTFRNPDFLKIISGFAGKGTTETSKLFCPHGFPKQVGVLPTGGKGTRKFTYLVEVYDNKSCFNIVKYPA